VSRSGVRVRLATPDDVEALVTLAGEAGSVGPARTWAAGRRGPDGIRARCLRLLEDPDHRVLLAVEEAGGTVMGAAVLGQDSVTGLFDPPSVYVSALLVSPACRKRGAGRALVSAAAAYAEELGVDSVVVGVAPTGRDANRFFARLGFAPLVIRRIAPVAALRRTLGPADTGGERCAASRRDGIRARSGLARALPRRRARAADPVLPGDGLRTPGIVGGRS
jgi:ribosomal protein S18 acetylase RimI-like enzyme